MNLACNPTGLASVLLDISYDFQSLNLQIFYDDRKGGQLARVFRLNKISRIDSCIIIEY